MDRRVQYPPPKVDFRSFSIEQLRKTLDRMQLDYIDYADDRDSLMKIASQEHTRRQAHNKIAKGLFCAYARDGEPPGVYRTLEELPPELQPDVLITKDASGGTVLRGYLHWLLQMHKTSTVAQCILCPSFHSFKAELERLGRQRVMLQEGAHEVVLAALRSRHNSVRYQACVMMTHHLDKTDDADRERLAGLGLLKAVAQQLHKDDLWLQATAVQVLAFFAISASLASKLWDLGVFKATCSLLLKMRPNTGWQCKGSNSSRVSQRLGETDDQYLSRIMKSNQEGISGQLIEDCMRVLGTQVHPVWRPGGPLPGDSEATAMYGRRCAKHIISSGVLAHTAETLHAYRTRGFCENTASGRGGYLVYTCCRLIDSVMAREPRLAAEALAAHSTALPDVMWVVACPAHRTSPMSRGIAACTLGTAARCGALGMREGALKDAHTALMVVLERAKEWPRELAPALQKYYPPFAASLALEAVGKALQQAASQDAPMSF